MTSLTTTPPQCETEDWLCRSVLEATGNDWLAAAADWLLAKPAVILTVIVVGVLVRWMLNKLINRVVRRAAAGVLPGAVNGSETDPHQSMLNRVAQARREQRAETMGAVLRSVATFTIATIVVIMILSEVGVNIGPLIAGAGIVGIALGFGAQSLVSDFLSGIAMLLEDQYGIGDVVDVGDASGTVEAVTLRVTRLRDVNGTVWYVRNGEILRVGNMSQNWSRAVLDVSVGYGEDLAHVRRVLEEVCHQIAIDADWHGKIMDEPEVWGVERMDPDGVAVRVAIKTVPLGQWEVARELRRRVKERFEVEGIEIPFPQRMVWHRYDDARPATHGSTDDGTTA